MSIMLRLLSDEDLQGAIVSGLVLHFPAIDLVRAQDIGLMQTPDPVILEYAASQNRVMVTHDRNTMTAHAQDRINQGLPMSGLIVLAQFANIGKAIQDVGTLAEAGDLGDLDGQILFLS
jgi:predicted nuclease of predicted toxin-antitoxin system